MPLSNQKINSITEDLVGKSEEFSLEARIFHAVCLFSILLVLLSIPLNIYLGIPNLALILAGIFGVGILLFYLSRYKRKLPLAVILFGLSSNCVFIVNYIHNSGSYGPSLTMFLLSLLLIIAVAPPRQHLIWIPLNLLTVSSLLVLEYHYPQIAASNYRTDLLRFMDLGFSYFNVAVLVTLAIIYIRRSFYQQEAEITKKAHELAVANETKNKLFSIVAHDLRSPLSSIQNYLELLNEHELTEQEKKLMEQELLVKTKDTGQMLLNILNWSMKQMGGVSVSLEHLEINEALMPVLNLQNVLARDKGIELKNEISSPATVYADLNMLQLVVRNVVSNAIKFTPPNGLIKISSTHEGMRSKIIIEDSGVGMSEHQKQNLFTLKIQPSYGTENEKGLGLGLVLCKEFIELQNGTISFDSELGRGTTVCITLNSR